MRINLLIACLLATVRLALGSAAVVFAGSNETIRGETTKDNLRRRVEKSVLPGLSGPLQLQVHRDDGLGVYANKTRKVLHQYDVYKPDLGSCIPRISEATPLPGDGIYCSDNMRSCDITRTVTNGRSYSYSMGQRLGGEMKTSGGIQGVIQVEITLRYEANWQHTTETTDSVSTTYHWQMEPGTDCVPSMISVDLECDFEKATYWVDLWAYDSWNWKFYHKQNPKLEYRTNRHESDAPYWDPEKPPHPGEQYCRGDIMPLEYFFSDDYRPEMWTPIYTDDKHKAFAKAYSGNTLDLNGDRFKWRPNMGPFDKDELIVWVSTPAWLYEKKHGDGDYIPVDQTENVFRCKPARHESGKVIVPIKGANGGPQGMVGCISDLYSRS